MRKATFKSVSIFLSLVLIFSFFSANSALADETGSQSSETVSEGTIINGWNADSTKFYENGAFAVGFKTIEGKTYYFNPSNGIKTVGLKKIDNDYYFFDEKGAMNYLWVKYNNAKYYFSPDSGKARKGLAKIKGSYYYFGKTAKMKTGLISVNSRKYYFDKKTGKAIRGLKKVDGKYYYFGKNYKAVKGWKNIKKSRYYFNSKSYSAVKGLKKINGGYYYFDSKCKMVTGWKTINNNKYYFSPNKKKSYGKAVTGKTVIDNKTYFFTDNGKLINQEKIMQKKANGYSSATNYLILVNKTTHRVGVFKGKKNNWDLVKYYECTIGAPSTPTPSGTFTMGPSGGKPFHQLYFDSGSVRCWYASRIHGGYNFHSVLYTQASKPIHVSNPRLGANLSHGCVRLKIENAKWIYNNIPAKTKCVIY